jgi:calcineurin-like phosphoesterase family protein
MGVESVASIWPDLHLGCATIVKYCNCPFADMEEMDKALLHAWRVMRKSLDMIIHLGMYPPSIGLRVGS